MAQTTQTKKRKTASSSRKTTERKKEVFLTTFDKGLGNISTACDKAGIGRSTFYRWIKADKKFAEAVDDINEKSIDFAETALKKLISDGNVTSIIFYLKTKGKDRGYVEKIETEELGEKLPPVQIVLPDNGR